MTISLSEFLIDTTKETYRFLSEILPDYTAKSLS